MTKHNISVTPRLNDYIRSVSLRENEVLRELREETATYPNAMMQISAEQGQFMALLVKLIGAVNAIEIGVFTGYSALWVAMALPPHGRLIACDINKTWTAVARRYSKQAGVLRKVDLRLAPAIQTLEHLIAEGRTGEFDFVFIDADKEEYRGYYELSLRLLRPGGLIAVDNVLWSGSVADPRANGPGTRAIRQFNQDLRHDRRVDLSLLPIADGLTLAMKRA